MTPHLLELKLDFDPSDCSAVISRIEGDENRWADLIAKLYSEDPLFRQTSKNEVSMTWSGFLRTVYHFQKLELKGLLRVTFTDAAQLIIHKQLPSTTPGNLIPDLASLPEVGFTGRTLTEFQVRDINVLSKTPHGANFSVPGSGKTTLTVALHALWSTTKENPKLLVVCPKNAFIAWEEAVQSCMSGKWGMPTRLDTQNATGVLRSSSRVILVNYEIVESLRADISAWMMISNVHLVADESHRMKGGASTQRGQSMLLLGPLAERRDILSGTPAPQSVSDIGNQMGFLFPTDEIRGLQEVNRMTEALKGRYVRTTKSELGLEVPTPEIVPVTPSRPELALYGALASETARQLSGMDLGARAATARVGKKVMRLIQCTSNPKAITHLMGLEFQTLVDEVSSKHFVPAKLQAVAEILKVEVAQGRKLVVWSSFRETIESIAELLDPEYGAEFIHGGVPTGSSSDIATREGRVRRFHDDANCRLLVANPAACGEGISLHKASQTALYVDRTFNVAHFVQSSDRTNRLGMPPGVHPRLIILKLALPEGVPSIDESVSRRLAEKVKVMSTVLDDKGLELLSNSVPIAEDDQEFSIDDMVDIIRTFRIQGGAPCRTR
jgi:SNF2 family DNA or RNA helicase